MALEILNRFFVLLGRVSRCERAKVPTLASLASFLREYKRYSPVFSFRIIRESFPSYFPGATLASLSCPTSGLAGFDSRFVPRCRAALLRRRARLPGQRSMRRCAMAFLL